MSLTKPIKLQTKMILLILGLLLIATLIGGTFSIGLISSILEEQISQRAMQVSQTVAMMPLVQEDLGRGNLDESRIQEIVENIRKETGAQFIVVGDHEGKRYSHPVKERLGKFMVGGDNDRALQEGKSYISKATGTLGPSIRGKVPVFNRAGEVIGIVSVGYLVENVNLLIRGYHLKIISVLVAIVLFGIAVTIRITNAFKNAIHGLEPEEIASLLQERTTTLEAVREGIMAVNAKGYITTINQAAVSILGLGQGQEFTGMHVKKVFPETKMLEVLQTGESQLDKILLLDEKEIIVNRIPMVRDNIVAGVVSSFRDKDELDILTEKLSQMEKYSEMLRAQTHEYSNKLHTIAGLIQIGADAEAVELIGQETSGYQELLHLLMEMVGDPLVAGVILGKYNKARELKVDFTVDPEGSMADIPQVIKREKLVTIIGNILDNCFDSVLQEDSRTPQVRLSMVDLGDDLVFEFDDSGRGVGQDSIDKIFTKGFSTKQGQGHGMGLFLAEKSMLSLGGTISVGHSDLGGASFTVIIPKEKKEK